jgi:transcriptional regulator with XRE-family HTH domain
LSGPDSDEHDLRALGRAVRDLREQRHLTLATLATAADIPEAALAAIEAGRLDPGYRLVRRLAAALGLTSTALLLHIEELDTQDTA